MKKSILISKVTTIPILISINPIAIWGGGVPLNNGKNQKIFLIYYVVGNANTQRQENELVTIIKKQDSAELNLISKSTAIVDTKNQFQIFIYFGKKKQ